MTDTPEQIWAIGEEPCAEWEGFWHISPPSIEGHTRYLRADLAKPFPDAGALAAIIRRANPANDLSADDLATAILEALE